MRPGGRHLGRIDTTTKSEVNGALSIPIISLMKAMSSSCFSKNTIISNLALKIPKQYANAFLRY